MTHDYTRSAAGKPGTRVLIVDDHPVVRQGLRSLLSQYPDIHVVGEADGAQPALVQVEDLQPDVVLVDIRMVGQSGLDLARELRRSGAQARVIILTSHEEEDYLVEAAQAGVHGYLLKSASAELLAESIRAAHAGEHRLSPQLVSKVLRQLQSLSQAQVQIESGLTDQELALLRLLAEGASTAAMAEKLHLGERTVKRKIQDILTKLEATSRAHAVAEALHRGLI
ncbi:MAG: response regulator transcription factor [Chloroflexi bacterium]|nr:response regulator transcription factor [Chloroflexota bacterium]